MGPHYGYFPNAVISWLLGKQDHVDEATLLFDGSKINIPTSRWRLLGAALGSQAFMTDFCLKRLLSFQNESITLPIGHMLSLKPAIRYLLDSYRMSGSS